MAIVVGLTGGIGSGKTTVAHLFDQHFGIPIYFADQAAKRIVATNPEVKSLIISHFGAESFTNGTYNRTYMAGQVFSNPERLAILNQIIHPAVQQDFTLWKNQQKSLYVIKEAAILFESGSYKDCQLIISVIAPEEERIKRVMLRDHTNEASVRKRMQNQWNDAQRIKYSDFIINNTEKNKILDKIKNIHWEIIKKIKSFQL